MATEEYPVGLLAIDPEATGMLGGRDSDAYRLAMEAQREALRLIDQLAAQLKAVGLTPAQIEEKSGLPAAVVADGLESGDLSLAAFVIIARVLGARVRLDVDVPVSETPWPQSAEVVEFPRKHRWSSPLIEDAPHNPEPDLVKAS